MGTHRYTLTPSHSRRSTNTRRHTRSPGRPRARTAYTATCTHRSHTQTHAPHLTVPGDRERSADRRQDAPPGRPRTLPSRKTTCQQPRMFSPLPHPPPPLAWSNSWGPRSGRGFLLEGGLLGHLCECGVGWRPVGPPTRVLLAHSPPWRSRAGHLGTAGSVSPGSRL